MVNGGCATGFASANVAVLFGSEKHWRSQWHTFQRGDRRLVTETGAQHDEARVRNDRRLRLFLTLVGAADLLAVIVVFLPTACLGWAHEAVGLGSLPDGRIVGYLARSTSLLYGIHGAMLLVLAIDVARYRDLIRWYGRVIAVAGWLLVGVDIAEAMPVWWTVFEGIAVVGIGVVILTLCHEHAAVARVDDHRRS